MGSIAQVLDQTQISQAVQQAVSISNLATRTIGTGQFVFFAGFDGTNNNLAGSLSGDPQNTNVAQLFSQVDAARTSNLEARYYAGPGTEGTLTASSWLGPLVTQQLIDTAERAYQDFRVAASDWLRDNPGGSITTAIATGSRGYGSGAIFSQLLYERGLTDPETGAELVARGRIGISAGLILDPVVTGASGNYALVNAQNVAVVAANNEYRVLYQLADLTGMPGVSVAGMTGNHCDILGGYDNGLGGLVLKEGTEFFKKSGLSIADVPDSRTFDPTEDVVIHTEGVNKNYTNPDGSYQRIWDEYGSVEEGTVRRTTSGYATPPVITTNGDTTTASFTDYKDGTLHTARHEALMAIRIRWPSGTISTG